MRLARSATSLALAFFLALVLASMTAAYAGTTGGVSGVVTASDGTPIANATVSMSSPAALVKTSTDAKGHFVFLSLDPGNYTLSIAAPGYAATSLNGISIDADNTLGLPAIQLTKAS